MWESTAAVDAGIVEVVGEAEQHEAGTVADPDLVPAGLDLVPVGLGLHRRLDPDDRPFWRLR